MNSPRPIDTLTAEQVQNHVSRLRMDMEPDIELAALESTIARAKEDKRYAQDRHYAASEAIASLDGDMADKIAQAEALLRDVDEMRAAREDETRARDLAKQEWDAAHFVDLEANERRVQLLLQESLDANSNGGEA